MPPPAVQARTYTTYYCGKIFLLSDHRIVARSLAHPEGTFSVDAPFHDRQRLLRPPTPSYYTVFIYRYLDRWERRNRALAVRVIVTQERNYRGKSVTVAIFWYGVDVRGDEPQAALDWVRQSLERANTCDAVLPHVP